MQAGVWEIVVSSFIAKWVGHLRFLPCKWLSSGGEMGEVSSQREETPGWLKEGKTLVPATRGRHRAKERGEVAAGTGRNVGWILETVKAECFFLGCNFPMSSSYFQ